MKKVTGIGEIFFKAANPEKIVSSEFRDNYQ
jgi:hypothetical protein